jgi:hypothetical protein
MNWLDMLDPQKRKALELMQQQQMQQQFVPPMLQQQMPQGMGALQDMPMPMAQGQAGYGVLAPQANTAMNQAAAGGAQTMGQALPGMLMAASALTGGGQQEETPPPAPPSPGRPVGTQKSGLPRIGIAFAKVKRRRPVRGLLGDE